MVESKIKYISMINIEKKGPCFKKASVNTKPAIYPDGIDPQSPKNIFADGLLCLKKERKEEGRRRGPHGQRPGRVHVQAEARQER